VLAQIQDSNTAIKPRQCRWSSSRSSSVTSVRVSGQLLRYADSPLVCGGLAKCSGSEPLKVVADDCGHEFAVLVEEERAHRAGGPVARLKRLRSRMRKLAPLASSRQEPIGSDDSVRWAGAAPRSDVHGP
jgi:hypothetical protein